MDDLDIKNKPQHVYNMDEKGCRLTIHHQQSVLAQKGVKRVHMVAPEHAESVTVVACCNALGNSIPPMIIFKGKRLNPELTDNLPHGLLVKMAPKGCMTTELFVDFLNHFSQYIANNAPTLLVFDGASSHLDYTIADAAESLNITLLCLPSNTTHELQPLDKAVFRSFEAHWDQELLRYWDLQPNRTLTKARFNIILSAVWPKCMTHENIINGFKATGLFPMNLSAIPECAYAPSCITYRSLPKDPPRVEMRANQIDDEESDDEIPLSVLAEKLKTSQENDDLNQSFKELLPTPIDNKERKVIRKKALNYKAQLVTKSLFGEHSRSVSQVVSVPSSQPQTESWYCVACDKDEQRHMCKCLVCETWYHEDCVGIDHDNVDDFVCPECSPSVSYRFK